ncbi:hypothetical protein B0I35DRAFT_438426 [Stachybotrys elegans]|uniref:Amidohydrolase-related domain-containing protein n=1 Tax=Stachybotrys elegans TaxID=80388 RepID=A0A8K0WP90_9HYPO|nr:hypothetical protein B0I35DRAFT_438426 [Stachybotrys elegans]
MMDIHNVILPFQDDSARWDINVEDGTVKSMKRRDASAPPEPASLMLPSLCHPHIHLDKAYLLTCNHPPSPSHPDYSDLTPENGTFKEALANTSEAKKRYTPEDLYLRGSQLLATSYAQGVTAMRVFVELDHVTGHQPLKTAMQLKADFQHLVEMQICAFAQDPIFSTGHGNQNRSILMTALEDFGDVIDVIGTTPYVEKDGTSYQKNIEWAIQTALKHKKHLDFHIEYNLENRNANATGAFNVLLAILAAYRWPTEKGSPTIVLGHATRITQASHSQLSFLADEIRTTGLPIHFVGLPTSDLFMMGRPAFEAEETPGDRPLDRPRGTLNVPTLIQKYNMNACLSVNNVGNAFTPYGTGDPLTMASWGVGIYHAGTTEDAKLLYEAISTRARRAIMPLASDEPEDSAIVVEGKPLPPMLLIKNEETLEVGSATGKPLRVQSRQRLGIADVVWDPPETRLRQVIQ